MRSGDRAGKRGRGLDLDDGAGVGQRLSLRVADEDDLAVLASVLQDAVIAIGDIRYIASEKLFVMLASRFRWEAVVGGESENGAEGTQFERIHCGVSFEAVESVKVRGMDLKDRSQYLDLLTVLADENSVILTFAGGAAIRLDVPHIRCHMRDMGEPWPTTNRPDHKLAEGG